MRTKGVDKKCLRANVSVKALIQRKQTAELPEHALKESTELFKQQEQKKKGNRIAN